MRSFLLGLIILATLLAVVPLPAQAFSIVQCGTDNNKIPGLQPSEQCDLNDLLRLIMRLINYLVSVAALVAIYQILAAGFWMATALGNPETVKKNKEALQHAVIGFALILLSFVFVNLLVNGIFGKDGTTRRLWDIDCLYDITTRESDCPI